MNPAVALSLPSLVTMGPGLYASYMDRKQQREIANANNQQQLAMAERNEALQREFAQNGIRWRVQDARMAGINPLAALGASGSSFSPVQVGYDPGPSGSFGSDLARGMSTMGQDLTRALQSTQTEQQRELTALQLASAKLDVEGKTIDNQMRLTQLQKARGSGVSGPGSQNFVAGQGNSGLINNQPMKRVMTRPGRPDTEPGAIPGTGHYVTADGTLIPVPSKDTKEAIEDNFWHETAHFWRNNIVPNFNGGTPPEPGYYWDIGSQGYRKGDDWLGHWGSGGIWRGTDKWSRSLPRRK